MPDVRYGPLAQDVVAGKTGREILEDIINGLLPQPPISQTMSFWISEVGNGIAIFEGDPRRNLLNPMGNIHGGWALTLIDSACACAAQSVLPAGSAYTTIETKGNFTRPITKDTGRVRAEARVVGRGRKIISAEAKISNPDGKVLAHGTSTILVFAGSP